MPWSVSCAVTVRVSVSPQSGAPVDEDNAILWAEAPDDDDDEHEEQVGKECPGWSGGRAPFSTRITQTTRLAEHKSH